VRHDVTGEDLDRARLAVPTARSSVARTESSADVEATATRQPAASASATILAIPERGGTAPDATSPV
jgi:hypothetical protein